MLIGAGAVILVWLINISGIKEVVRTQYFFAALFLIAVGIIIFAPPVTGNWTSSTLHFFPGGGSVLTIALVWMYVMGWTTYGTEICATMAPEFRNTTRDVWRALAASGVLLILFYVFTTLAVGGGATTAQITASPSGFYGPMINGIFAGGSDIIVICLVASVLLVMNSCTADAGRALYQTARDGLTLKQLGVLNKNHTPARAMTVDLVVNLALVFFVASPLAVLLASNLGYFISVIFALSGFVLLRKDRPTWPRPIKLRDVLGRHCRGVVSLQLGVDRSGRVQSEHNRVWQHDRLPHRPRCSGRFAPPVLLPLHCPRPQADYLARSFGGPSRSNWRGNAGCYWGTTVGADCKLDRQPTMTLPPNEVNPPGRLYPPR